MHSIKLVMSDETKEKLRVKHQVEPDEVTECFLNRKKGFLIDTREKHRTDPPTQWFVSCTDRQRKLKVVFIRISLTEIEIKTAYEPNIEEVTIYDKKAKLVLE
ncbi:MAG: hypothetical protein K2Y22_15930 [Candidatus Obscuribacterales bacterium]|nr:hypothetical protein [Candidatus Obscuribacterales bacterium]